MNVESSNLIKKGRRLFLVIVATSIILQLAPEVLRTDIIMTRLIIPGAGVILYSFLAYNTYKGHRWARITLAVVYLATLVSSIYLDWFLVSHMDGRDFVRLAYEALVICFVVFSAIALLRSKSLLAFVQSNQTGSQENPRLADTASDAETVIQPTVFARLRNIGVHHVILGVGVFILFTQYVWKTLFVSGTLPGAYWLFHFLDEWFLESIKYTFMLAVVVFLLWILSRFFLKEISTQLIKTAGALMVVGAAIIITFPVVFARNTVFIEKLHAKNKVYYLSAYPMFAEINYSVAECEFTGQFCRTIFVSGDITGTDWPHSHLLYDESKQEIMLMEAEEGLIFSKALR